MGKRIVVALGGNALGNTPEQQLELVKGTAKPIVDLVEKGYDVIIGHGNGPQVGMINLAMEFSANKGGNTPYMPFPECGAMTQGYIGYHLQQAIQDELNARGIKKACATVVTQVVVDESDPGFQNPTKPVGSFYTKEEADAIAAEKGFTFVEDAGRGYRRVVPSPILFRIVAAAAEVYPVAPREIVRTEGGGGIPVVETEAGLKGVAAVIDKDLGGELLAEDCGADVLVLLTAVDHVAINFGTPEQVDLTDVTVEEAERYLAEGQFGKGSMEPKVAAGIKFAKSRPGRVCIIGSLDRAGEAMAGKSGTRIHA